MLSILSFVKVLVDKNNVQDYRDARIKRTIVIAIECISVNSRYLTSIIIWSVIIYRSNQITFPIFGQQYVCFESRYIDFKISLKQIKQIFDSQTKKQANQKLRVLTCDNFGTHETLEILEYCFEHNIVLCRLFSYISYKLQFCNVVVFVLLKLVYRKQVEQLEQEDINTIRKEHFISLYSLARKTAFMCKNIKAGFAASKLILFNLDRVLRVISKFFAKLTIPKANKMMVKPCALDKILQTSVILVFAKALILLQNQIIKQDAYALDKTIKQSLQRHVQKLINATQMFFAKSALQQDQIRFLITINNEVKVRRSTKPVVLGKSKVISYKNLLAKRAKREAKEQDKAKRKTK